MSFDALGLETELLRAVADQGYTEPTPVQRKAIPPILQGRDLLAGAQTGTGKTAGFTLPLLQRLGIGGSGRGKPAVRALILTPTRELTAQVGDSVRTYGKYTQLRCATVFGGVNINPQIKQLNRGVDILVATPGRLLDHVGQKNVDLSQTEILVLDEADRMLDMGFLPDLRRILKLLPRRRQNLLFSATFPREITRLAGQILKNPVSVQIARNHIAAEAVSHLAHPVDRSDKRNLLIHLIQSQNWRQVLVFTNMKHTADRIARHLQRAGISAQAIHGDKGQKIRLRVLDDFKKNKVRVLIASDLAARGLDIDQLPHVVNFDLPTAAEIYVHRIGRTGRAGNSGEAVSLVAAEETNLLEDIEALIGQTIERRVVPGFEPDPRITRKPMTSRQRAFMDQPLSTTRIEEDDGPVEHWSKRLGNRSNRSNASR